MRFCSALIVLLHACAAPPPPPPARAAVTVAGRRFEVLLRSTREARKNFRPDRPTLIAYPRPRFHHYEFDVAAEVVFFGAAGRVLEVQALEPQVEGGITSTVETACALFLPPGTGIRAGDPVVGAPLEGALLEDEAELRLDSHRLYVEVAKSLDERLHGLMYRPRMSENNGMIFVYDQPETRSFWMGHTLMDLDIAFFRADGSLINVVEMKTYPDPAADTGERAASGEPALYVLELNRGWFRKRGLLGAGGAPARPLRLTFPGEGIR